MLTGHEARNHTAIQVLSVFNTSVWGYGGTWFLGVWEYGDVDKRGYRNVRLLGYGDMGIWGMGVWVYGVGVYGYMGI